MCKPSLFISICVALISCGTESTNESPTIRDIRVLQSSVWGGDFILSINRVTQSDSMKNYHIVSKAGDKIIGFELGLPKSIPTSGFSKGLVFKSLGDTSNNFLKVLSQIYKEPIDNGSKFIDYLSLPFTTLNHLSRDGTGQERSKEINYLKVFFQDTLTNDYGELYISINESKKYLEIEEKDPEYRKSILIFLSQD